MSGDAEGFAEAFVGFVRGFGLLEPEQTPCGAPMAAAEAHALSVLRAADGLSQGALGHELRLAKSSTSRLVDGLQRRGWVRREAGQGDGRVRLLLLTEAGRRAAEEVSQRRAARLAALLAQVPDAKRPLVVEALHLLKEATHDAQSPRQP